MPVIIRTHWNYVHRGINVEMKCRYCDYKEANFSQLENKFKHPNAQLADLELHLKEMHRDEAKLLYCQKCNYSTYHEPSLNAHEESLHDLDCKLCKYEASSKKALHGHITKVHGSQNLPIVRVQ